MTKKLEILKNSLIKKQEKFDNRLQNHFDTVKQANGQPLNDKRNGRATLNKWGKQENALHNLSEDIEKTKRAIEIEESRMRKVEAIGIPEIFKELVEKGTLIQWRKHPRFFFIEGVEKARILYENGEIFYKYLKDIPNQQQYAIFRDVVNGLNAKNKGK